MLAVLHVLQWTFASFCLPLLGFLLYALFMEWKKRLMPTLEEEFKRGFAEGRAQGYAEAHEDVALVRAHEYAVCEEASSGEVPT